MRFVALAMVSVLLSASAQVADAQQLEPQGAVVEAFQHARAEGDLSTALVQFSDDAVVTVQTGRATQVFAGREQVRAYLQSVALEAKTLMRSSYRIDGPFVRWTERDQQPRQMIDATVQATVQSGRIQTLLFQQTEAFGAVPSGMLAEQARDTPSLAWPAALGSAFFLFVGFMFRPRRRLPSSQLNGRLHAAMRLTRGMGSTT